MEDNKSAGVPDWNGQVLSGKKKEIFFVPYLTRPHTCRHTYAQMQLMNGLDIYSLSRILGHESISVTQTYLNVIRDERVLIQGNKTSPLMNL